MGQDPELASIPCHTWFLWPLHYPPQDADEDNLFGQAPHTDNSFMTALARTEVDLVLEFYRANYLHQKGHRSAAAAMVQAGG
jgi:hypothetical protein